MSDLLDPLLGREQLRPLLDDRARLQGMLDFEAALAWALAQCGVIPSASVAPIAAQCQAQAFDLAAIAQEAAAAGNIAIPLVKHLTLRVRTQNADAARHVHWGATSQDVIDTGLILQLRRAIAVLEADLAVLGDALADQARRHVGTVMAGRTWLQQALPITFGLKAATWLDAIERHRARLVEIKPRLLVLQFGGAAGTLASLGPAAAPVAAALAQKLELALPDLPWHGQRDRLVEFAAWLGIVTASLGKIARDIALMMQSELGEAFEAGGPGKGGSSTMPHKRNPVLCAAILEAATRAPGLVSTMLTAQLPEHERGLGGWHAEWTVLPELLLVGGGALHLSVSLIQGLQVDAQRMRANLDVTRGLIMAEALTMALAPMLGKEQAHHLVEAACRQAAEQGRHLREVAAQDATIARQLDRARLEALFDPASYLGQASQFVERVLQRHKAGASGS